MKNELAKCSHVETSSSHSGGGAIRYSGLSHPRLAFHASTQARYSETVTGHSPGAPNDTPAQASVGFSPISARQFDTRRSHSARVSASFTPSSLHGSLRRTSSSHRARAS